MSKKNTHITKDIASVQGAGESSRVEEMEEQGQKELVKSSLLPIKVNFPRRLMNIAEQYALMGIKVIGKSQEDDLFFDVVLPDGWEKEATEHSMWSVLLDDKGRERASIFYKAASYDRDSFVNFVTRYSWRGNYEEQGNVSYIVEDNASGEVIFETEKISKDIKNPDFFKLEDGLQKKCKQFLKTNFPEHEDINAYWNQ